MLLLPKITRKLDERLVTKLKTKNEDLFTEVVNLRDENMALREDTRVFREEIMKLGKKIEALEQFNIAPKERKKIKLIENE